MNSRLSRRSILRHALVGGTALGLGHTSRATQPSQAGLLLPTTAAGAQASRARVEPLVRLLEETPRDRVLEAVGEKIREGATYSEVLAALLLAGVREVEPRPTVGFQFHTVLAVISYHLIGQGLEKGDGWLPVFWGIDYFKAAQARDASQGDWELDAVNEAAIPPSEKTAAALNEAMERWEEPAADAAAAAVARRLTPDAAFELFYPLGARDFRSIGHKAIFVMCAERTLALIGWEHAEAVLRSLAYALLMHDGGNPASRDDPADRPWRRNEKLVGRIPRGWKDGQPSTEATSELLALLRTGSPDDLTDAVIEQLGRGVSPSSIWDAVFCGAAELQLRLPNIVSLHAATTTRSLHYAYRTTARDRTRRLMLLQNAAMLPMFRDAAGDRGQLRDAPIDALEPIPPRTSAEAAAQEILEDLGGQRRVAAQKILGYFQADFPAKPLTDGVRQLVAVKGNDAHDFKFTSAVLESCQFVSKPWRDRYLACGAMHFSGLDQRDNAVVGRARAALGQ